MRTSRDPAGSTVVDAGQRSTPPFSWAVVVFWLVVVTLLVAVTGVVLGRDTRPAPFLVVLPALLAGAAPCGRPSSPPRG